MDGPLLMFLIFVVTMAIGIPIPIAAGIATAFGLIHLDIPLGLLAQTAYTAFEPFPLMTIPMFVLAGQFMEKGGLSSHLINIAQNLVGAYKGGLGLVTVLGCMFFAALSGSGPATTAAIGSITIPAMIRENYSGRFAAAVSASAGALGSMIPPSNHLIIYGLIAEQSIPRLFLAGFLPGIFVGLLLLLVTWIIAKKRNYGGTAETFSIRPLAKALWEGKWAIGAPLLILGGIYAGIFTPTEAAAVAVFYGLFVGVVVYKKLGFQEIYASLKFTALMVGGILLILGSTKAFGQLVAFYDIPQSVQALLMRFTQNAVVILLIVGAFYILVGMWLESIPQIIIFTPVLLPIAVGLGVDPILFGILTVMTCEVGFLSPPIGANLFVASKLTDLSIEEVSWAVIPFMLPYILCLVLLSFFSGWVLFLPNLLLGAG